MPVLEPINEKNLISCVLKDLLVRCRQFQYIFSANQLILTVKSDYQ